MHSVDSAVSLRSQHHADRIRWAVPPRPRYSQQRSVSDLELTYRVRQEPPVPPRTNDIQYLDNPAENSEFAIKRNSKPRADDEYYRHLTARPQEHWQQPPQQVRSGLRRSRSLAVIREESCPAPLIPRARLADKPLYKERLITRSKHQSKEEALERVYNKSTSSCYADVSDNPNHTNEVIYQNSIRNHSLPRINSPLGPWPHHHQEECSYSRNPSEIDSLDSNYIHKHFNFDDEGHGTYKESSPDTTDQERGSKQLFIPTDNYQSNDKEVTSDYYLPEYVEGSIKSESDRSTATSSESTTNVTKSQTNFHVLEQSNSDDNDPDSFEISSQTITIQTCQDKQVCDEDKDNVSVTSYISISPPSSTTPPRRLENLAFSLAEKIDEYCESKYSESFIEIPLKLQSPNPNYNSKSFDDLNSIYSKINKCKPKIVKSDSKLFKHKVAVEKYGRYHQTEKFDSNIDDLRTRSLYRQSSSSKNITTEPFVTTLIENQYYSLPDINIGKNLRRSERIDAKLRRQAQKANQNNCGYIRRFDAVNLDEVPLENAEIPEEDFKEINVIEVGSDSLDSDTSREEVVHKEHAEISNSTVSIDLCEHREDQKEESDVDSIENDSSSVVNVDGAIVQVEKLKNDRLDKQSIERELIHIDLEKRPQRQTAIKLKCSNSFSEDIILKPITEERKRNPVTKHYSLRQREPVLDQKSIDTIAPPNPPTDIQQSEDPENKGSKVYATTHSGNITHSSAIYDVVIRENHQVQRVSSFKCKEKNIFSSKNKDGNTITILPLSGHQTVIVEPYKTYDSDQTSDSQNSDKKSDNSSDRRSETKTPQSETDSVKSDESKTTPFQRQIPKVKRERSFRIAEVQNKFEKPPLKLIIRDKKILLDANKDMSRPQILSITDSRSTAVKLNRQQEHTSNNDEKIKNCINRQTSNGYVNDKIDKAIKTDLEYQEKLHSVKNYWSKLIDNTSDEVVPEPVIQVEKAPELRGTLPDEVLYDTANNVTSVEDIVKSIETVKIVDSIKKKACEEEIMDVWKKMDGLEKEKAESVIEESTTKKEAEDPHSWLDRSLDESDCKIRDTRETQSDTNEYKSYSPEIEIVELENHSHEHGTNGEVKHTALIKTKNFDRNADFDHVRYKVMKSDLFRKSIIANYKKEAQFDGLLQYLQDYSFQELLVNNNIVIIEPVRTKIEIPVGGNKSCKKSNNYKFGGLVNAKNDKEIEEDKLKKNNSTLKRHFFYHPIRVNREIIDEELPNPDTVKTVRNLFENTLKMRRPDGERSELDKDSNDSGPKRSRSHRNLSDDSKLDKNGGRKKVMRYLTIDTSYGQKKWDSASLSSGVSSGDLSSNNEHDYDTDALSPYQGNKNNENIYSSSSEEYLCESLNTSLCYESQYVSQDILQKIRECGTSITYYGGKVLDENYGPAVSPMTKAIMDEIRGLQRNCCRDCEACKEKCTDDKCSCLNNIMIGEDKDIHSEADDDKLSKCCACSEILENNDSQEGNGRRSDNYLGFKFKLVKSNSCSSRLELAGTNETGRSKKNGKETPPIMYDNENSVKTKICRIESYRQSTTPAAKGNKKTEITINNQVHNTDGQKKNHLDKMNSINVTVNNHRTLVEANEEALDKIKSGPNKTCQAFAVNSAVKNVTAPLENGKPTIDIKSENDKNRTEETSQESISVAETIKNFNTSNNLFSKKYYYVNSENATNGDKKNNTKFGEMIFEEFEVMENAEKK